MMTGFVQAAVVGAGVEGAHQHTVGINNEIVDRSNKILDRYQGLVGSGTVNSYSGLVHRHS